MKKKLSSNIMELIILTLLLKLIGFLNRSIIAYKFGTSEITDAYYTASGLIDSLSAIMLSGISVGIIKVYLSIKDEEVRNRYILKLLLFISVIMTILSILSYIFVKPISYILISSNIKAVRDELCRILRILYISLPIQSFISVFGAVLQAEKCFLPVKLTGTVTSIINILCVSLLSAKVGINTLVISYILGTIINGLLLYYYSPVKIKRWYKNIHVKQQINTTLYLAIPLIISMTAHQINLIIDKSIASTIVIGAISALSYASYIYLCIENVFIQSVATAIFPEIAMDVEQKSDRIIANKVLDTLIIMCSFLVPVTIISFLYSNYFVKLIYMRGNFEYSAVRLTSSAFKGYVLGIPFLAIRDIITRVYYAYGYTKFPMYVGFLSVIINIILDIILSKTMGIFGLTLATTIANILSAFVLCLFIRTHAFKLWEKKIVKEFLIIFFNTIISIVLWFLFFKDYSSFWSIIIFSTICFGNQIILGSVFQSLIAKKIAGILIQLRINIIRKA